MRACFVGAPSTGKTTLAQKTTTLLGVKEEVSCLSEYATEFQLKHGTTLTLKDQVKIFDTQRKREKSAVCAENVISECPSFLNYIYLLRNHGTDADRSLIATILKEAIDTTAYYDHIFYLPLEFKQVSSPVRVYGEADRIDIDKLIINFLLAFAEDQTIVLTGPVHKRLEIIFGVLQGGVF